MFMKHRVVSSSRLV